MSRPIAIDLFSGCGGMGLGLEAAGFDIACSVEIDPIHSAVHHFNFPYTATICQDICACSGWEIKEQLKAAGFSQDVDLVAGGSPCQGYSNMGRKNPADPRNDLIFEFKRIVLELQPKYFLFENVPASANKKNAHLLDALVVLFEKHNYHVLPPLILDCSKFGVPQKRDRLFLLGHRTDVPKPDYPIPFTAENIPNAGDALMDLAAIPAYTGKDGGLNSNWLDDPFEKHYLKCHQRNQDERVWGHLASLHSDSVRDRFSKTEQGTKEPSSRFFKLHPDKPCRTIRAGTPLSLGSFTAPRPIHFLHPRCITIREALRLHSYPDWFQVHRSIWHGFREVGNSVPPLMAKALGEEIIKLLNVDDAPLKTLDATDEQMLSFSPKNADRYWRKTDGKF